MNRSANAMIGGVASAPELLELATDWIMKWFRPPNHVALTQAASVRRDERFRESRSLEQALSRLQEEFVPGGGVRFRVFVTGHPRALKPAIQEQVYLIGREALINALRHSVATSIEAEIEYLPRQLRILVRDNGCGMDPEAVTCGRCAHFGLLGMRERAAGIGAEFRIWSRLGAGTEVEISLPGRVLAEAYA